MKHARARRVAEDLPDARSPEDGQPTVCLRDHHHVPNIVVEPADAKILRAHA